MGHSRVLFSLAALSVFSQASTSTALGTETDLKPGEATVTVSAEAQPVAVTRTPAPVRIVEADELARLGSRTLGELLEAIQPGASMPQGGTGSLTSVFLNGTLSRNVVVLLDGMRLNDPTAISPDLGALSLIGIARVELVLGPSSVLYGSDAIGGVIALTSLGRGAEGFHGQIGLRLGTDGQIGGTAQVQLTGAQGWIAAGAEALKQNNGFPGDEFHQAGGFLRLGTNLGGADLTVFYRNSGQTASVPFATIAPPPTYAAFRDYEPARETQARQESWGASLRWPLAPNLVLEDTLEALSGSNADPNGAQREQIDRAFRRVADQLTLNWTPLSAFRLSGRIEGSQDTSHAMNYYDPSLYYVGVPYLGEGHDLAGALESRWTLAEGLDWVAGLRRDAGHRDLTRLDTDVRSRVGTAEASTWRTGLNWVLRPELRLYASAGQGFRMPNTTEFTLNAEAGSIDGKSYTISPERSRTLQVGATGLCAEHWEYRLEAQRTVLYNLLAYLSEPAVFTDHYVNAGRIRAQSLEGALGWRGGADQAYGWELILRSQETRDLDHNTPGQEFGQQNPAIVRHPFFTSALSAFAQTKAWRGDIRFDHIGSRYDLNDTTYAVIPVKPYNDLSAGLAHEPMKGLTLALRGEHLLQPKQTVQDWLSGRYDQNGNAALAYGFPAPEPRWTLSATWRW